MTKQKYCHYNLEKKFIIIEMDKIFGRPDIAYMNTFKINKRSYYKILHLIEKDYNIIIDNYPEFLLSLLEVKYANNIEKNTDLVVSKINEIIEDEKLYEFIDKYVEENYTLNLDKYINVNDKNAEYAINDDKNKIILKTSMVARLLIPLLCETSLNESDVYFLFTKVMRKFDNDSLHTVQKLYKFIKLRIDRTIYSDKVIWKYLKVHSIDPTIFIRELTKSLTVNIITKLDHNKSAVSYLDVVIKEKVKFAFTYNYPINIKSIKSSDQEFEEKEKLEIHMLKHDEGELLLHKVSIEHEVSNIEIPEEYKYLVEIHNPYTSKFLSIYYSDKFDSIFATPEQRAKLILKMKAELIERGYEVIPEILTSEIVKNEKRLNNRKKLNEKIISSEKYMDFLHKYKDTLNLIEKNNPILQLITVKNNKFVHNGEEIELPLEELSGEILDLV